MSERSGAGLSITTNPWEIAQQLRDSTDVLRITMGEHQSGEPIHAGPVQILRTTRS